MTDSTQSKARHAPRSGYFRRAKVRASEYVEDRGKLRDLVDRAVAKSDSRDMGQIGQAVEDLKSLIRLVRAYAAGEYRDVRRESLVLVTAAILYFVSPIDLVPDFLPGGLLDDAAVLAFVIRRVRDELDVFAQWEDRGEVIDLPATDVHPSDR